jgi:hypothetical protein
MDFQGLTTRGLRWFLALFGLLSSVGAGWCFATSPYATSSMTDLVMLIFPAGLFAFGGACVCMGLLATDVMIRRLTRFASVWWS